jgi:hypothetical protein
LSKEVKLMTPLWTIVVLVVTAAVIFGLELLPRFVVRFIKEHAENGTVQVVVGVIVILVVSIIVASIVVYPETTMLLIQGLMSLVIIGGVIAIVCKIIKEV